MKPKVFIGIIEPLCLYDFIMFDKIKHICYNKRHLGEVIMKKEEINDLYMEGMYLRGRALLKYFNGLEITDEEAYLISKVEDKDIIPAIRTVQLNNNNQINNHFAESTTKIKFAGYQYKLKKTK